MHKFPFTGNGKAATPFFESAGKSMHSTCRLFDDGVST